MERLRYHPVGLDEVYTSFEQAVEKRKRGLLWVTGVGGSGKSSFAFNVIHKTLAKKLRSPLPVLIDEDWTGSLAGQIASQLRLQDWDRGPTEHMVKTLGAAGLICPLVDSLSERAVESAEDTVRDAVSEGHFRHLIVTSRSSKPTDTGWQWMQEIKTRPIERRDVPEFINIYGSGIDAAIIKQRIAPLVNGEVMPSPLFLRFAIEHAAQNSGQAASKLEIVQSYVEALRAGKIDISPDDMQRAAAIAAVEAVRDKLLPQEIDSGDLRGIFRNSADELPFMDAANAGAVEPAAIVEIFEESGLLNRNPVNRRLQFAYDPVAEYLAAGYLAESKLQGHTELRTRVLAAPRTAIAAAMRDIKPELFNVALEAA